MSDNPTQLLFSYGTLQNIEVQLATFGRKLTGFADCLLGYELIQTEICDCDVVALSGSAFHPIAIPNRAERVRGMVFALTSEELARSDDYEVAAYRRVRAQLQSGQQVWAYVRADTQA